MIVNLYYFSGETLPDVHFEQQKNSVFRPVASRRYSPGRSGTWRRITEVASSLPILKKKNHPRCTIQNNSFSPVCVAKGHCCINVPLFSRHRHYKYNNEKLIYGNGGIYLLTILRYYDALQRKFLKVDVS